MQNKGISKETYRRRIEKICRRLEGEGIAAAVLEDTEGSRTANISWLSGMPSDALLFIIPGGEDRTVLVPWDFILAEKLAFADEIIPYGDFNRQFEKALDVILEKEGVPADAKVELPSSFTHHRFMNIIESRSESGKPSREYLSRSDGFESILEEFRMIKDDEELEIIREASRLTNRLLCELEMGIRKGEIRSEIDVALFIERRSRTLGCEGTGFETIAAGPGRSWGIHAFPLFTAGDFGTTGFSLVDFGVSYRGYTTDVTASFIKAPLSKQQKEMVALVEEAFMTVDEKLGPGITSYQISDLVAEIFRKKGWVMPHALGHGYGLDIHEAPFLRSGRGPEIELKPGMVLAVEPGLYHEKSGGVRWENDFLITENGCECLTSSRIIRLPE